MIFQIWNHEEKLNFNSEIRSEIDFFRSEITKKKKTSDLQLDLK